MEKEYKILIADDEEGIRDLLSDLLHNHFDVLSVDRGDAVLGKITTENPDILILDIQLPGMSGLDILRKIHEDKINIVVIILTASSDVDNAITSMKLGAYDYIVKPFKNDKLMVLLKNIIEKFELQQELDHLREQVGSGFRFKNIIGASESMRRIFQTLEKVIDTDSTILIIGESGTGKEVIAKSIHYNSNRRQYPFRSIDCSTIPRELLESELFGHEKGSFTGAVSKKIGKFEIASKGTLFLDEISNLPFDVQAKLLRVLQEKEFERIGGNDLVKVNTRIVAASNRDVLDMVKKGKFREDLYYRLNVVPIYVPPLNERKEDIPLFIDHFLKKYNMEFERNVKIDLSARLFLSEYDWPGNVRQLENIIKRMILLTTEEETSLKDVKSVLEFEEEGVKTKGKSEVVNKKSQDEEFVVKSIEEVERNYLEKTLEHFNYNISNAARALKISRKTMHNKLNKYGIVIKKTTAGTN